MSAIATAGPNDGSSTEADLFAGGFRAFQTAESKGHAFEIWLKAPAAAGRTAWKAAVVSRGSVNLATAYVAEDGVLRASVPIAEPRGHLLFRVGTIAGVPMAAQDFQCKFGAA